MKHKIIIPILFAISMLVGCGKDSPAPSDPCQGVNITVNGSTANPSGTTANGNIIATASGGTGPYTYSLNGGPFQATGQFANLAAGSYTITAKSAVGCTGSATFTLGNSDPCQGVTITVTGNTVNPSGTSANGSITANAAGGTGPYTYSLNGGPFQATGQFANLAAGSYTVTAKSAAGCTGSATFTLGNSDPCQGVTITVTGNTVNPSGTSANGSITANAAGGTGPYTYSLNGGPFQATGQFANLAAGSYTVTAKSAAGCTGSAVFTLSTSTAPCTGVNIIISPTVTGTTPCVTASGIIVVIATGGTAPYSYNINNGAFQSSSSFQGLNNGTYQIGVKDVNGCTATLTGVTVESRETGPKFAAVKQLIQANCVSCHNGPGGIGGMNLSTDCNIVSAKERIKARAVDGTPSPMPSGGLLPPSERQKIIDWIAAGGRVTD
ncbi:MAG: c-type cytochrome [Bacteroidetes bacterium]|nr:c-type cytochrome [Bacteroidota bacterium]